MTGVERHLMEAGTKVRAAVPEITLRCLDDVWKFAPFVDWLHRNIKGWNPTASKPDCFACSRCNKELPFTDGGAMVSFKIDSNGWTLYVKPIQKGYEFAMCLPCMKEVLSVYGMKDEDIENICMKFLPCYVEGENVIVKNERKVCHD